MTKEEGEGGTFSGRWTAYDTSYANYYENVNISEQ
jgi:hypothetical protein